MQAAQGIRRPRDASLPLPPGVKGIAAKPITVAANQNAGVRRHHGRRPAQAGPACQPGGAAADGHQGTGRGRRADQFKNRPLTDMRSTEHTVGRKHNLFRRLARARLLLLLAFSAVFRSSCSRRGRCARSAANRSRPPPSNWAGPSISRRTSRRFSRANCLACHNAGISESKLSVETAESDPQGGQTRAGGGAQESGSQPAVSVGVARATARHAAAAQHGRSQRALAARAGHFEAVDSGRAPRRGAAGARHDPVAAHSRPR